MKQVVIENPVINSPYDEPKRHFKFTEEGITDEIIEGIRRPSSYFALYPLPWWEKIKVRGKLLLMRGIVC